MKPSYLGSAHSTHFLCGANRPDSHANTKCIGTSCDQKQALFGCDDVARNNLEPGVRGTNVLDHFQLVNGRALG